MTWQCGGLSSGDVWLKIVLYVQSAWASTGTLYNAALSSTTWALFATTGTALTVYMTRCTTWTVSAITGKGPRQQVQHEGNPQQQEYCFWQRVRSKQYHDNIYDMNSVRDNKYDLNSVHDNRCIMKFTLQRVRHEQHPREQLQHEQWPWQCRYDKDRTVFGQQWISF